MKFDIDRINVNSTLKYRLIFIAGGIIHACYIGIFWNIGIMPLVAFNVFSVLLYLFGSFLSVSKKTGLIRYGWMVAFYLEILVHTLLCMLLIGLDTNFYLYVLAIVPVSVYVMYLSYSLRTFLVSMAAITVTDIIAISTAFYVEKNTTAFPYYPLTYDETEFFRIFNVICCAAILLVFSFLFALEIHMLLKRLEESNGQLKYIATHDALTGLFNRRSIRPLVEELAATEEVFCVALGDIDDFKKVNDTYGHDAGDTALKTVARIITDGISEGDIACRWGGEEMLLVLRGSEEECLERLTGIWKSIGSAQMPKEDGTFGVTITFGFVSGREERNIEKLVSLADKRLYIGKTSGKNRIISE